MKKRAIDLTDDELTEAFRSAARQASLEAAQCGLSVAGSVTVADEHGRPTIRPAVRHPSGEIKLTEPVKPVVKTPARAA